MRLLPIICIALVPVAFTACRINVVRGEGTQTSEERPVKAFTNIEISVPVDADITVKEGAAPSVRLTGYGNLLKNIKTETDGKTLRIFTSDGWNIAGESNTKAEITVPSLAALLLEGAPTAFVHGTISGPEFALDISGAADATIDNMNVTKFSGDISGAGTINLKGGKVEHASYDITGAGDINAYPLQTMETTATVSGAGDGKVSVQNKLEAHISGTGGLHYKGHPQVVSEVSGVGSVTEDN